MDTQAPERLDALRFTRRKESWVAAAHARFYKITRASDDPLRDLDDPACIAIATNPMRLERIPTYPSRQLEISSTSLCTIRAVPRYGVKLCNTATRLDSLRRKPA